MKLSVVLPSLSLGGAERMHIDLAGEWLRLGHEVDFVLFRKEGDLLGVVPAGARVTDLGADRFRDALFPLRTYLRTHRPDALLAAMWPCTTIAVLAARTCGVPVRVAVSEHSILSKTFAGQGILQRAFLRMSMALSYRLAQVRIAVSCAVAQECGRLAFMPQGKMTVIHNPAAKGLPPKQPPTPPELVEVQRPIILAVGRLKEVKNFPLLIDAFARLLQRMDATLFILGEGEARPALEAQVARLGLTGRVVLPGFRLDPGPWYATADLLALSSSHEGFGNVLVEAMEHGLSIVSTNCPGGPREVLADGEFGTLVPMGDPDAFSDAMVRALKTPTDPDALRARAREFSVQTIAARYLEELAAT